MLFDYFLHKHPEKQHSYLMQSGVGCIEMVRVRLCDISHVMITPLSVRNDGVKTIEANSQVFDM